MKQYIRLVLQQPTAISCDVVAQLMRRNAAVGFLLEEHFGSIKTGDFLPQLHGHSIAAERSALNQTS